MKSLKFSNIARARPFSYIYRFKDDLNSINDYGEFEKCSNDIYVVTDESSTGYTDDSG